MNTYRRFYDIRDSTASHIYTQLTNNELSTQGQLILFTQAWKQTWRS